MYQKESGSSSPRPSTTVRDPGLALLDDFLEHVFMPSPKALSRRLPARHLATILFCDIRGFSSLFDERDPMEALDFANSVLSELGMVVEACGGVIDKFTGDGFLAHFGVLESSESHSKDACWCAVRMREALVKMNFHRHSDSLPVVEVGIGIHVGEVASGVITTVSKAEFTVLGGVVNMASRIESLTKEFSLDCLVSEDIYEICKDEFQFKKMPVRTLRGIRSEQATYWLMPTNVFIGNVFPNE